MGLTLINKLPTSAEIRGRFLPAPELIEAKHARGEEVKRVFIGGSGKFVVIVGPCLADSEEFVCDYIGCPVEIQERAKDKLIIIPRVYTDKPKTTDEEYMGVMHQPDPEKQPDMFEGILAIRHMRMRVLWETGFSTVDEVLYLENINYLSDMMSCVAISARSVENQFHRLVTSGCDVPVGMRNPTSGGLTVVLGSMVVTQLPHDFIFRSFEVQCPDNPLTRTILRGAINRRGQCNPNCRYEDLKLLFDPYNRHGLQNPARIVGTNHVSPNKRYHEQIRITREVLHSRRHFDDIKGLVKGPMIESCIEPGNQKIGEHRYGKPIIDPCLGWDDTERLLYEITGNLNQDHTMTQMRYEPGKEPAMRFV